MKNHCCINTIPHRHNNSHNSYTNTKGIPTESFIGNTVYLAMNNNYMSRMDRIGKKSYWSILVKEQSSSYQVLPGIIYISPAKAWKEKYTEYPRRERNIHVRQ